MRSRRIWYWTAAVAVIAAAVRLYSGSTAIQVREIGVRVPNLATGDDGFSVALVSDTHFGPGGSGEAERIADTVNALDADVILLLGDFVNGSPDPRRSISMPELAGFVKRLRARRGVLAVTGNHEMWYGRTKVAAALEAGGAEVITGRRCDLKLPSGEFLQIVGLPDRKTERKGPLPRTDPHRPLLIAMHDPNSIIELPTGYDRGFAVAGHTHGGQLRLFPGEGGTSWRLVSRWISLKLGLSGRDKDPIVFFDRGLTDYHGHKLYISSGLGTARLKLRIFCPPEIALLKLRASHDRADTRFTKPLEIP